MLYRICGPLLRSPRSWDLLLWCLITAVMFQPRCTRYESQKPLIIHRGLDLYHIKKGPILSKEGMVAVTGIAMSIV